MLIEIETPHKRWFYGKRAEIHSDFTDAKANSLSGEPDSTGEAQDPFTRCIRNSLYLRGRRLSPHFVLIYGREVTTSVNTSWRSGNEPKRVGCISCAGRVSLYWPLSLCPGRFARQDRRPWPRPDTVAVDCGVLPGSGSSHDALTDLQSHRVAGDPDCCGESPLAEVAHPASCGPSRRRRRRSRRR